MKRARLSNFCLCIAPLAGCAGDIKLLEAGKAHIGRYNPLAKQVEVGNDSPYFSGKFFQSASVRFGTAFDGGATSTGTTIGSGDDGCVLLASSNGKLVECGFQAAFG